MRHADIKASLQDARAVGESYDWDELDDEWKELLGQVDASLQTVSRLPDTSLEVYSIELLNSKPDAFCNWTLEFKAWCLL